LNVTANRKSSPNGQNLPLSKSLPMGTMQKMQHSLQHCTNFAQFSAKSIRYKICSV